MVQTMKSFFTVLSVLLPDLYLPAGKDLGNTKA